MNIVLDSNVIIAAYAGRGLCSTLFEHCLTRYTIIISDYILKEVYAALIKKIKLPSEKADLIIDYLKEFCVVSDYDKLTENVCRDSSDDDIIALAVSQNAEYLITGYLDLLVLKKYKTVRIISPREFWVFLKESNV